MTFTVMVLEGETLCQALESKHLNQIRHVKGMGAQHIIEDDIAENIDYRAKLSSQLQHECGCLV
jgi:hypothetical protein